MVAVILIAVGTYFGFTKANPFDDPFVLNAIFTDANRITKKSPVRIAGVEIGKVVGVEPMENGSGLIRVKMEIRKEGLPIKKDAELKIRSRLFLEGNYFVDVRPGTPSTREIADGGTIGPDQTASPVQFGELLTSLQNDTRENLRGFLREYSSSLKREGAQGFNDAITHWEEAYKKTSQVNDATRGEEPHDLTRVLKGQGRVFGALSKDEELLEELVSDLNETVSGFARQEDNLRRAIPELRDVFRVGRPALGSLNRALPEIRAFARDALPGARSSSPTLDAQLPFIRQARALVSEPELKGLTRELRRTVPLLVRLNTRAPKTFEQNRALAACQNQVLLPFARTPIPDPDFDYHDGEPWFEESSRAFVGLSGESRLADANSPFFRTLAGGGPETLAVTGEAGQELFAQLMLPLKGTRPTRPTKRPPFRPNVPCETQEPPNLNAVGGSAPATMRANGDVTSNPLSLAREKARPEQYRRLREYADRTKRGLPAPDPLVWFGAGERKELKRLGLFRDEQGRLRDEAAK